MELKEFFRITQKHKNYFITILVIIILAVFGFFYLRPDFSTCSLTLNIGRIGTQNTDQFKYDDFYHLQADEKFAETLVQWLRDPRVVSDIYYQSGIDTRNFSLKQLQRSLSPEKLSSQVVTVNFSSHDNKSGEKISQSIVNVISKNTESLNQSQNEQTWFKIVDQKPVIVKYSPDFKLVFLGSLFAGLFIGFWAVMLKHYLE
ncbi:MAG TPA: hypothetical protein VK255_02920 [Patescibacteria group bacterium]|nr:hypothetical protein [Patescibacteria group bacterium]